jgi:alginate O-acetyltransferase complex protein AlgI
MVFNSLSFLVFFVINLFLYFLPISWRAKKINLLLASYFFYAAWSPPFVLLLLLSSIVDFTLARWMADAKSLSSRRLILFSSLVLNLGLLTLFKYGAFIVENVNATVGFLHLRYEPLPIPTLLLPLGISFYTFETVSYLIDVYRKRIEPSRSFLDYALFLTFFPHLVAGPIVRAADFLPQCVKERKPSMDGADGKDHFRRPNPGTGGRPNLLDGRPR